MCFQKLFKMQFCITKHVRWCSTSNRDNCGNIKVILNIFWEQKYWWHVWLLRGSVSQWHVVCLWTGRANVWSEVLLDLSKIHTWSSDAYAWSSSNLEHWSRGQLMQVFTTDPISDIYFMKSADIWSDPIIITLDPAFKISRVVAQK